MLVPIGSSANRGSGSPAGSTAPLFVGILILLPAFLTYALVTTNEYLVISLMVGFCIIGLILARPFWGLIVFITLLYVRPEENVRELAGMHLPLFVSVVTLFAGVLSKFVNRIDFIRSDMIRMLSIFAVAVIISSFRSSLSGDAIQDISKVVILVFLIVNLVDTEKRKTTILRFLTGMTFYISAYSIYLFYSGVRLEYQGLIRMKATGLFGDPNDLAASIVPGMALSLYRVRINGKYSIVNILYVCVSVYAIYLTSSRGGLLAALCVLSGFFVLNNKKKMIGTVVSVIVGVAFVVFAPSRMKNMDSGEQSANDRFKFWLNGIDHFLQSPVIGTGYHTFPDINGGMTAHNSFVLCFTENGLLGYYFWIACIYFAYARLKSIKSADEPFSMSLMLAISGLMMAYFWISRTYNLILYVYFGLSAIPAFYKDGKVDAFNLKARDYGRIFIICVASIVFIRIFAMRLL